MPCKQALTPPQCCSKRPFSQVCSVQISVEIQYDQAQDQSTDHCCEIQLEKYDIEKSPRCLGKNKTVSTDITLLESSKISARDQDIEADAARGHFTLEVSGMTCTGCSRKLNNVLERINGVSSVKVTFVTGTVEFDLDQKAITLQHLLPRIEKETGFEFFHIVRDHQILDVVIGSSTSESDIQKLHLLCETVTKIENNTYRIIYDPTAIGARSILSILPDARLAALEPGAKLAAERHRLISVTWLIALAAALTIPIVVLAWSNTHLSYFSTLVVELVLATGVKAIAVPEFYLGAVKALVYSRVLEMDMLVVLSITAAYGYSVVAFTLAMAGRKLQQGPFFETSCLLITLVLLGRLVAAFTKARAIAAVSVRSLQVKDAILVDAFNQSTIKIDARLLQLGDTFLVPPHSIVVTDGQVVRGVSSVDESMLTGEAMPVTKNISDHVVAGTMNGSGILTVRLTRLPGKNSITDIASLVENALASKPHIQDLADRVAGYFIPVVVGVALVVFIVWIAVELRVQSLKSGSAVGSAITYAIVVLAVSCPCAIGLAVPMVLVIASGVAARRGVIIRRADVIEKGYRVTDVVFDKTGTLTTGELEVSLHEILPTNEHSKDLIVGLTKALTKGNQHPISLALSGWLDSRDAQKVSMEKIESVPGAGVRGTWHGKEVRLGNPFWLGIEHHPKIPVLHEQALTLVGVTISSELVAAFGVKSTIHTEAAQLVAKLQQQGLTCHILNGDTASAVHEVAANIAISSAYSLSRQSPAQKQQYIQYLMAAGKTVLFCGDSTNDAAAVAQANIGVRMGNTSDITRATADVVLLGGLDGLLVLLESSKRSVHRIWFNFIWSAHYNIFAILLASGAFVKVRIPPAYAGLGEIVSVVPLIVVAATMMRSDKHGVY